MPGETLSAKAIVEKLLLDEGDPIEFASWIASSSRFTEEPQKKLTYHPAAKQLKCGDTPLLTKQQAIDIAQKIDTFYVGTDLREKLVHAPKSNIPPKKPLTDKAEAEAKTIAIWRGIYQRADRYIPKMLKCGSLVKILQPTYPCHHCGMVVPEDLMQIDHYLPKVDGQDASILKALRMQKLTVFHDTPRGKANLLFRKGGNWLAISPPAPQLPSPPSLTRPPAEPPATVKANSPEAPAPDILIPNPLGPFLLHPKGRLPGNFTHYENKVMNAEKWTTTDVGSAFLSLFCSDETRWKTLRTLCLNSVLNLVPLCCHCNKQKDNRLKKGMQKAPLYPLPPQKKEEAAGKVMTAEKTEVERTMVAEQIDKSAKRKIDDVYKDPF